MRGRISIGVIIAIALIIYWWMKDHPRTPSTFQGQIECHQNCREVVRHPVQLLQRSLAG